MWFLRFLRTVVNKTQRDSGEKWQHLVHQRNNSGCCSILKDKWWTSLAIWREWILVIYLPQAFYKNARYYLTKRKAQKEMGCGSKVHLEKVWCDMISGHIITLDQTLIIKLSVICNSIIKQELWNKIVHFIQETELRIITIKVY